jgi:release factor glutamine methyltransferase
VGETVRHEPQAALFGGPDGMTFLRRTIAQAGSLLRGGGKLILEFGFDQADAVRDAVVAAGAYEEPRILRDHHQIERVAVATRQAQG